MILRNRSRRPVLMRPADDLGAGGGGGGESVVSAPVAAPAPIEAPAVAATPAAPVPAAVVAPAPAGPKSLLEAVSAALPAMSAAPAPGQPRDELGRFTFKDAAGNAVDAQGNLAPNGAAAAPGAPAAPTATPAASATPDDPLAMPEGLQPKAQERFQRLANTNKELTGQLEQATQSLNYVQRHFRENNVQQEQFEQFATFAGMLNRGDYAGCQRVLMEQLQQVALLSGQPLTAVDPLAQHPDLRQRVDSLQISEADAIELARHRFVQTAQSQAAERTQRVQQEQQAEQQAKATQQAAVNKGLADIDAFCKQMKATDLDYQTIEEQLLADVPELIKGMPPERWVPLLQLQYRTIKNTAAKLRQQAQPTGTVLRPTGQASPSAVPRSMHEAIWGAAPRA